jgi:2-phospho-L-lactate transferase/gluconeogenesis factor (CofD/UPF0052 family)
MRNITVLAGGMGGARFLRGLWHGIAANRLPGVSPGAIVTVIANTADDLTKKIIEAVGGKWVDKNADRTNE